MAGLIVCKTSCVGIVPDMLCSPSLAVRTMPVTCAPKGCRRFSSAIPMLPCPMMSTSLPCEASTAVDSVYFQCRCCHSRSRKQDRYFAWPLCFSSGFALRCTEKQGISGSSGQVHFLRRAHFYKHQCSWSW